MTIQRTAEAAHQATQRRISQMLQQAYADLKPGTMFKSKDGVLRALAVVAVFHEMNAATDQHGWLQGKGVEVPTASTAAEASRRCEQSQQTQQSNNPTSRPKDSSADVGLDVRIVVYPMGLHELCTILAHHDGVVDIECLPQADVVLARFRGHEDVELVVVDIDGCCSISYISCTDPLRHSARPQDC
ncbi:hypothetical protein PTSG_00636 [Salpingoeca rosetta]|uniref:Uncharacterized protein n=1 Tax=Salpingoeca rosetta (strain ATCC 50818 / BSB-021) TaxID=946362 RepID=F2TX20_SALR5|nr:uncharacterized protein PTSG_00636 [Salpingoeca rosetta]EGD75929.1 hypothetical protein PTSG_00636 [Salpingoeca rosetta]|eukprot:XP_004998105.1 hypothetical protein PTSG_00636 [Salpingoeca rosetta]